MKKLILAAALFILAASAMGQQTKSNTKDFGPHAQSGEQLLTNTQCQSTFYVASPYVMEWCTSLNGNISHIQTPAGWEQIYFGAEGYGICDLSTHQAYYDWGQYGDSGNVLGPFGWVTERSKHVSPDDYPDHVGRDLHADSEV